MVDSKSWKELWREDSLGLERRWRESGQEMKEGWRENSKEMEERWREDSQQGLEERWEGGLRRNYATVALQVAAAGSNNGLLPVFVNGRGGAGC